MKDINYFLALRYPIELVETDEGFVASNPDLPGCASFGDTAAEAVDSLKKVRELWLRGQVEANGTAPEPRPEEEFSGRFVVRLPKWLHRMLDAEAKRQDCSLNTFVVSILSVGLRPRVFPSETPSICKRLNAHGWSADVWGDDPNIQAASKWDINAVPWSPHKAEVALHLFESITRPRTRRRTTHLADDFGAECHVTPAKSKNPN